MNNGNIINGKTCGTSSFFGTITPTKIPKTVPLTNPINKLNNKYQK